MKPTKPEPIEEGILQAIVVWHDGSHDHERDCNICYTQTCIKPVHGEQYRVLSDKLAKEWDEENPVV